MAKVKKEEKKQKITHDLRNNGTESTTEEHDDKDASINALKNEIENLKKKIADQDEIMDDLAQERDDVYHDLFEVRLVLADAWKIERDTNPEKIWEVLRRTREIKAAQAKKKPYSEAVKSNDAEKEANTNQERNDTEIAMDSGIDMQSLEKLIEERVAATVDATFEKHIMNKATNTINTNTNSSTEFTEVITEVIYTNKDEISDPTITPMMSDRRELNIIIHGLKEDGKVSQCPVTNELFETLELKHHPTTSVDRLGAKSQDKIRPIRVTMESYERKQEFMSSLWKLKHGPDKFQKISITDDYTQDERREIKRWVEEAKKRTQDEDGYVWKVRGSPRSKIRLVKMRTTESRT